VCTPCVDVALNPLTANVEYDLPYPKEYDGNE
jgi:hypothetical protein